MNHYQQTLHIDATPRAVHAALATSDGIAGWWTTACNADMRVGGMIHLRFGVGYKDLRIARLDPDREVRWICTRAQSCSGAPSPIDEWLGTEIVFRLTPHIDGGTRLDFEHIGLEPALECYDLCRDGWRYFLASLKQLAETGRGTPFVAKSAA